MGHIGPPLALASLAAPALTGAPLTPDQAAITSLAAILPDLVDKPLSIMGFGPSATRRLLGHSLLFSLLLCLIAYFGLPLLWPWVLAAPLHLLMDRIWTYPKTMAWPLAGFQWSVSPLPEPVKAAGYLAGVKWRWNNEPAIRWEAAMEGVGLLLILWALYRF